MDELKKIFADNLCYWLESEGRRQNWLAGKVGVKHPVVTGWKTGERFPRLEHFQKLAEVMGVEPSVLLIKDGMKDPEKAYRDLIVRTKKAFKK